MVEGMDGGATAPRSRILGVATRRFVQSGFHGISMREIAEDVGLSKAALYYHFRDKESLFLAILDDALERLSALMTECAAQPTARRRLQHMLDAMFEWSPEQRAVIRLASQEIVHLDESARTSFTRRYHAGFVDPLRAIMADGVAAGEIRGDVEPARAAWLFLGMIYPFMLAARSPAGAGEGTAEFIVRAFFDGVAAAGGA